MALQLYDSRIEEFRMTLREPDQEIRGKRSDIGVLEKDLPACLLKEIYNLSFKFVSWLWTV